MKEKSISIGKTEGEAQMTKNGQWVIFIIALAIIFGMMGSLSHGQTSGEEIIVVEELSPKESGQLFDKSKDPKNIAQPQAASPSKPAKPKTCFVPYKDPSIANPAIKTADAIKGSDGKPVEAGHKEICEIAGKCSGTPPEEPKSLFFSSKFFAEQGSEVNPKILFGRNSGK